MLNKLHQLVAFFKEVFSEDGQGSFSRVIQGFIVLATCGWVTYVVARTHIIPDLSGPSTFVGAGSLHYVANKFPDIVSAFKSQNTETVQTPDPAVPATPVLQNGATPNGAIPNGQ